MKAEMTLDIPALKALDEKMDRLMELVSQLTGKEVQPAVAPAPKKTKKETVAAPVESKVEKTVTLNDVKASFAQVAEKVNAAAAKEIMLGFKVARVSDLDEKDYADVVAKCKAALPKVE